MQFLLIEILLNFFFSSSSYIYSWYSKKSKTPPCTENQKKEKESRETICSWNSSSPCAADCLVWLCCTKRSWDQVLEFCRGPVLASLLVLYTIYFISKLTENTAAYREYILQLLCIYLLCHTALAESTTNHAALWPSCESWRSHAPFAGPCTLLKAGDEGYCLCYCFYSTMIKKRPP